MRPFSTSMYKILIIDRCSFSRVGLESWLHECSRNHSTLLITHLNSLLLAKAHIESWQPHLVIADFSGFQHDLQQAHLLPALLTTCALRTRLLCLQDEALLFKYVGEILPKTTPLSAINPMMMKVLSGGPKINPARAVTPLLTRQEEKVLSMWMAGASNQSIASEMQINEKTVYTYKRNIRIKLKIENRFSPFIPTAA